MQIIFSNHMHDSYFNNFIFLKRINYSTTIKTIKNVQASYTASERKNSNKEQRLEMRLCCLMYIYLSGQHSRTVLIGWICAGS